AIRDALQAKLLVDEGRGLEALTLAVRAAGPYVHDIMSAPAPVLQALFEVQSAMLVSKVQQIPIDGHINALRFTRDDRHLMAVTPQLRPAVWDHETDTYTHVSGHSPAVGAWARICAAEESERGDVEPIVCDDRGRIWTASGELIFSSEDGHRDGGGIWQRWPRSVTTFDPVLF